MNKSITLQLRKTKKEKQNAQNHNCHKLEQSKNKIIPLSHMIILKNEKQNKQTYTTIEKDYKLCKKYGYKLTKICTVCMNDITQMLAILNAKIKVQTKQNTEILLRQQLPKNTKLRYRNKKQMKKTKFPKEYVKLINKNKLCENYGYKFKKILTVQINDTISKSNTNNKASQSLTNNDKKQSEII